MTEPKVLHVVNISFVLPYYIGEQFDFYKKKLNVSFYVACTPSEFLMEYGKEKQFTPIPVNIKRSISPFSDLKAIYTLIKWIKKENIDIVIGHTPKGGLLAMIAAFLCGVKNRVYFRHGIMYETSTGLKSIILKSIEKLTGTLADKVVCVSPSIMEFSERENLNSPSKNRILNQGSCNGLDTTFFSKNRIDSKKNNNLKKQLGIGSNDFVLGYVGRLVKDKGIPELIDAWKILLEKEKNIKLLLVGPFEERDNLSDEIKQYIISEPTIIHTGLSVDVFPYYSMMNVFILPSYREGLGVVILEASSMELPVITTRSTGCINAIKEHETGIFTKITPEDIADKILYYKQHPEIALTHGRNGRKFVEENFDQKIIWKEIEEKVFEM